MTICGSSCVLERSALMELSLEDPLEDEDVVLLYEPLDAFEVVVGLAFEVVVV